ncbi:MAG: ribosome recycling factor, partial [bacterium]
MYEEITNEIDSRMQKTIKTITHELAMVRTGRANAALLDRIVVEAYGAEMPLNQVASISVGDAQTILIKPFDRHNIGAIEKAIQKSDLGLMPQSDGTLIRLNIPPLTQDRRKEMVKMIKGMIEEGKVALRNIRREYVDKTKKMEKSGQ